MSNTPIPSIEAHFATLSDPRVNRTKKHKLLDIIIIAICAVICGADGWVAVEAFGHAKHDWLATFLQLPYGIPSHDTFGRVFGVLYHLQFGMSLFSCSMLLRNVPTPRVNQFSPKNLRTRETDCQNGWSTSTISDSIASSVCQAALEMERCTWCPTASPSDSVRGNTAVTVGYGFVPGAHEQKVQGENRLGPR